MYKIKIKIILGGLLFGIFVGSSYGQVPGYMGKRLIVNGSVETFFNLTNINSENKRPGLHFKYGGGLEYILSKSLSLAGRYEYFETGTLYQTTDRNNSILLPMKMPGMAIGLHLILHNTDKGAIAPYGNYHDFGIKYVYCAVTNQFSSFPEYKNTAALENYAGAMITYGFGRRWVLFDRLVLGTGFEFGYVVGANPIGMVSPNGNNNHFFSKDTNYGLAMNRISAFYTVQFKVGLGFLVF